MSCRLHYTKQVIDDIKENIIGVGRTSAFPLPNKSLMILLPVGGIDGNSKKLLSKKNTLQWARGIQTRVNSKYLSSKYGNLILIDNDMANGTVITINVPSKLIDAFEKRDEQDENGKYLFNLNGSSNTVGKKKSLSEQSDDLFGEYISQNNINTRFLDNLKQSYNNDPAAVYNAISNTIEVNTGKADIETVAEEVAHHLGLALGVNHPLMRRALNLVGKLDYKAELGTDYIDAYKGNEDLLKLEYLGKLQAKAIAGKIPDEVDTENEYKLWDLVWKIIEKAISLFKPSTNIQRELGSIIGDLNTMITTGTKVGNVVNNSIMFNLDSEAKGHIEIKKGFAMQQSNLDKLSDREKTFSVRPNSHPTGIYKFGNTFYNVINMHGKKVGIDEVGNANYLRKKFVGDDDIRYDHVKDFFDGKEKLYVYQIQKLNGEIQNLLTEQEAQTTASMKDYKAQVVYHKRRLAKLKATNTSLSSTSSEYKANEREIKVITTAINEFTTKGNKQEMINLAFKTLKSTEEYIDKLHEVVKSGNKPSFENMERTVKVLSIFKDFGITATDADRLYSALRPFIKQFILEEVNKYSSDKITVTQLDKIETDMFSGEANFGTLSDVKDYLGKTVGLNIKEAQAGIERDNKDAFSKLNPQIEKLKVYASKAGTSSKKMYDVFIQEYKNTTVLTKPYTSEFYEAIDASWDETNGKDIRKAIATYDAKTKKYTPRDLKKYTNPNYTKIMSTPELKEFHTFYKETIKEYLQDIPINKMDEDFIPNIMDRSIMDIIKSDKPLMAKLKDGIGHLLEANEFGRDNSTMVFDEELMKDEVPLKYLASISPDIKSNDLGTALLKFMYFSNSYKHMSEVLPKTRLLQEMIKEKDYIKNGKPGTSISGKDSNVHKMVDAFIKMQVKGEMKKDNEVYAPTIDFILKYTSLLRIGYNPFTAVTNVAIGNIANAVEAVGGRFFTIKDYTRANGIFNKQTFVEDSKLNKLVSKINPLKELDDYENMDKINMSSNKYIDKAKSAAYGFQKLGERQIQITVMIANMLHEKVTTKDGTKISLWEAFDEKGEWKEDIMGYKMNEEGIFKITNKIHRIIDMSHGRYSSKDASILAQGSFFRAAFQFKKWIPAAFEARFKSKRFDSRLDVEVEGRYHAYVKFFKNGIARLQRDQEKLESLKIDKTDWYNMRKNVAELTIALAIVLVQIGGDSDDDKLKKNPYYKFAMKQLDQISGDLIYFYRPDKMTETASNGIPMLKTIKDLFKVISNTRYLFTDEDDTYTRGRYKGEHKTSAAVLNVIPGVKQVADTYRLNNKDPYVEK